MTISHTAEIVAAYLSRNVVQPADLPALISTVHAALVKAGLPDAEPEQIEALRPAVSVRKSVTPDAVICLECGFSAKMLKRHLGSDHGLTPDAYRAKWGLPSDYPMVAPNYAKARSELALSLGLGRRKA